MFDSLERFSRLVRARVPVVVLILASGCGYAQYEFRLNESKKYYAYLDKIEQSLAPKWVATDNLMELRVPRQFNLIPAPQPIKKDDGTFEPPAIDPRQPDYLNLTFPELLGAWEAMFVVAKSDGKPDNRKGYLYALCNYWELAGEHAADAGEFVSRLKTLMADKLQTKVSDERVEVQPGGPPGYQPQSTYDVCDFKGKQIDGVNYTFEVYSKTSGSVIGVIVIVLPEGIEMPQKLSERIPLMLGSLSFAKDPPKPGAGKSVPGPAPAKAAPSKVEF